MGYPDDYPLELDSPEHYVFESEDLEEEEIIPIGTKVRSYDFVVGLHILSDDCYYEGVIEGFEPIPTCSPDCNHYIIRTTKIVRNGEEIPIVVGENDVFSTHWNNYGVIPWADSNIKNAETFEASYSQDELELAGYLTATGTDTKIAISKETLKHYTKEEVRLFIQNEIDKSTEYLGNWYYENFQRCADCDKLMGWILRQVDGHPHYGQKILRVRWE